MIDLHTHILPGMDDGSKSTEESIAMLMEEKRQGIDQVVLTSHFYAQQNSPRDFLMRRTESYNRLKASLPCDAPILHLGAEVQYFEGICQIDDLKSLTFDGNGTLLLEMPFRPWPSWAVRDVMELSTRQDLRLILAHIERYTQYAPKDVWPMFREAGIRMQCNATFFLGWKTRRKALHMLRNKEIQFIASDCHNMSTRPPNLGDALTYIKNKI